MAANREGIYLKLRAILAESLGAEEESINWDSNVYDDLNADIIEFHDEVVPLIEEGFDVSLDVDDLADLTTVRDLVEYVAENI
jgi:acyl carrier protein